jgi:hypothetical protein
MMAIREVVVNQYVLSLKLLPAAGFNALLIVQKGVVVDGVTRASIEPDGGPGGIAVGVYCSR